MYLSNQRTHLNNLAGMICNVDYGGVVIKKYKEMIPQFSAYVDKEGISRVK